MDLSFAIAVVILGFACATIAAVLIFVVVEAISERPDVR
jgi:hypothetical protein